MTQSKILKQYQDKIFFYEGEGTLTIKENIDINCKFEVCQLFNGKIVLACKIINHLQLLFFFDDPTKFQGKTSEGWTIVAAKGIRGVDLLSDTTNEDTVAFQVNQLIVQIKEGVTDSLRFGLCNFEFVGLTRNEELPLKLIVYNDEFEVNIVRIKSYEEAIRKIKIFRNIYITCELVVKTRPLLAIPHLQEMADDLCYILSLARGTKVQWVYKEQYDNQNNLISRIHEARVTKQYSPLQMINPIDYFSTKKFIESAYPIYVSRRDKYKLNRGTIDAYLDARIEQDYLESRCVKLIMSVEILKKVLLMASDPPIEEFIVNDSYFNIDLIYKLIEVIRRTLEIAGIDKKYFDAFVNEDKIKLFNRRSLRYVLNRLNKVLVLNIADHEIQLFICCRNSLVHKGSFYCNTANPEERRKCEPLSSPAEEHFFMIHFIDRIFLKLFGYSGQYVDWSKREIGNLI